MVSASVVGWGLLAVGGVYWLASVSCTSVQVLSSCDWLDPETQSRVLWAVICSIGASWASVGGGILTGYTMSLFLSAVLLGNVGGVAIGTCTYSLMGVFLGGLGWLSHSAQKNARSYLQVHNLEGCDVHYPKRLLTAIPDPEIKKLVTIAVKILLANNPAKELSWRASLCVCVCIHLWQV